LSGEAAYPATTSGVRSISISVTTSTATCRSYSGRASEAGPARASFNHVRDGVLLERERLADLP
jgi:hypothetical protein